MLTFINKMCFLEGMPAPRLRTRSLRRVFKKTPGGNVKMHYIKRKPQSQKCGSCGDVLKGTPRELPYKIRTMSKSDKRPKRPYGGVLCTKCTRLKIISKIRP